MKKGLRKMFTTAIIKIDMKTEKIAKTVTSTTVGVNRFDCYKNTNNDINSKFKRLY